MIQVLPIILVAAVMAVDGGVRPLLADWSVPAWLIVAQMWLMPALMLTVASAGIRICAARLGRGRVPAPLIAADRLIRATRWLIVLNQVACVLVFDGLGVVRSWIGDLVLIDEVIALLPALLALLGTWWAYFPIERILVEATLVRRLDAGQPLYPMPTRWQYVLLQARMHLLLLLVPVLAIAGASETIDELSGDWRIGMIPLREALTIAAAAGVFLVAPLLARAVLDVQPLPGGELREDLTEVCRRHRVRIRDLLLWRTNGSMINAAVIGLLGALRYVLVTDALLETLRRDQVRAVMAHEVGHVRRHHMLWLVACLFACFIIAAHAIAWPVNLAAHFIGWPHSVDRWFIIGSGAAQLALGLTLFGWVSRRFERQADTFAAQHLSGLGSPEEPGAVVTSEAVDALRGALGAISELNTVDPARHSWRHGSIRWRQRYLASLVGVPVRAASIDRLIRRLKIAAAIIVLAGVGYEIYAARQAPREEPAKVTSARSSEVRKHAVSAASGYHPVLGARAREGQR